MRHRIGVIIAVILAFLCAFPGPVRAADGDTGTYVIENYTSELDPWPGGDIMLTISQRWRVTGGHIPWVTVGLPNPYFDVMSFDGAAKNVREDNAGNWYGVYVELDKDYQPGNTFEFSFKVRQRYLMQNGSINYTPGWYDSAATDWLQITVMAPPGAGELKYYPTPSTTESSSITWEKSNLKPGEKLTVQVTFTGLVSATYVPPGEPSGDGGDGFFDSLIIPLLFVFGGGALTVFSIWQRRRQAAIVETQKRKVVTLDKEGKVVKEEEEEYEKPSVRPVTTHRSCYVRACACVACACVSCACACACAGGRGAGCAKKGFIDCEKCGKKDECGERGSNNP